MYNQLFPYLSQVRSFHVGEEYATRRLVLAAQTVGMTIWENVLDIGCGFGTSARFFTSEFGSAVAGVDINRLQVCECQRLNESEALVGDQIQVTVSNGVDLPYAQESFDVVWSEDCFSHIPDKGRHFAEVRRVLRNGGYLVFSDLLTTGRLAPTEEREFCASWCLVQLESAESYRELLEAAGFHEVKFWSVGREMVQAHSLADMARGDLSYSEYVQWLHKNRQCLSRQWSDQSFAVSLIRLKMYPFLEERALDHGFVVAQILKS